MRRFSREIAHMTALVHIGIDMATGPDQTAYWPRRKPEPPSTKKRAKVKAARKQRNRTK